MKSGESRWIWTRVGFPLRQIGMSVLLATPCYLLPDVVKSQTLFEKTFGGAEDDEGSSVQETRDKGFIINGYTKSIGSDSLDFYLIKTDSMGDSLWAKTYTYPYVDSSRDVGYSVFQNSDGGYLLVGSTSWDSDSNNLYMIRTDSMGIVICSQVVGGIEGEVGYSGQETSNGWFILAGYTNTFGDGLEDVYLVFTNPWCDTLMTRFYGGSGSEKGYSVKETQDGSFIVAGYTTSFGAGLSDVYLIKVDSILNPLWERTYGGTDWDVGYSVQQTVPDDGYVIVGGTKSFGEGLEDVYLIKTNSLGDTLWSRTYGGALDDIGYSVDQTSDGGYIITGTTSSFGAGNQDVWLIKTDSLGDTLWTCTFGGINNDWGNSVEETSDSAYIFTGVTASFGAGLRDVYLVKTLGCGSVGIEEDTDLRFEISDFRLMQNAPNPFHSSTMICFTLPASGFTSLKIYDITGRLVETLVNESQEPGVYQLPITIHQLPSSGIYFYRLETGERKYTRKMILIK